MDEEERGRLMDIEQYKIEKAKEQAILRIQNFYLRILKFNEIVVRCESKVDKDLTYLFV